ncbi:MAG: hypothetical protein MUO72_15775 [Bacteroidales bacterium]|nr:hypothetical protein [Bacteroidales bacterium]
MYILVGKPKSANDLNTASYQLTKPQRSDVAIVIIDDQHVPYIEDLRYNGFNVMYINDLDQIESIKGFEIIICDIKGVGKKFKSKYEGAHLISEIRRVYPFKIIIGYTAYTLDASYNQYLSMADDIFKKDIDLDDWISHLETAIELAINPIYKWKKISNYLQMNNIKTMDLVRLEDEYVRLIQRKISLDSFPSRKLRNNLSEEAKGIIKSFLNSLIIKLIFNL